MLSEKASLWMKSQPPEDRGKQIDEILKQFCIKLENDVFLSEDEIAHVSEKTIKEEFKKGRFTKMLSKKMCAKLDGKVVLHHSLKKQTAVFTELSLKNKKRVGYNYSVVNYFESDGGYIYILRYGIPYPDVYIFTGHFFDRLLERGFNNKDHAARMQAVFRLLRHMDRGGGKLSSFYCWANQRAYMSVLGGLCLGSGAVYTDLPDQIAFLSRELRTDNPLFKQKPPRRAVFFYLTYVNKERLGEEQNEIYTELLTEVV